MGDMADYATDSLNYDFEGNRAYDDMISDEESTFPVRIRPAKRCKCGKIIPHKVRQCGDCYTNSVLWELEKKKTRTITLKVGETCADCPFKGVVEVIEVGMNPNLLICNIFGTERTEAIKECKRHEQ